MSGIAVQLDFATSPAADRLAAIGERIAHRGPDRQATRTAGPCTLMHAALWTTPEAPREDQPVRHATLDVCLTADARIDNRAELAAGLKGIVQHPLDTDADFLLASYERWGADLVDHVVGDYAFALWDGEREELLVARDPFGVRPLFLSRTAAGAVVASTISAVLAAVAHAPAIDETYLAGFLHGLPPADRTIWAGISRLAPGHRCRIGRDRAVTERYWRPNLEPLDQSVQASAELVRTAFDEAVQCRLRAHGGVACDLSGGFDSSTITATAARHLAAMPTVSVVYRDPEAFELPHIRAVAEHVGVTSELIEADDLRTHDPLDDIRTHREPLYSVDATDTAARFDRAAGLGCSVVLVGVGGDELLHGTESGTGPLHRLRSAALGWVGRHPRSPTARVVASRRRRRGNRARPWLGVPSPVWPSLEQQSRYDVPWNAPALELTDRLAAERGVEARYPFLDRRLVEIGLRLPEAHVRTGGESRGLHRLAFGDLLPATVAARTDKAELTGSFTRRMQDAIDAHTTRRAGEALGSRADRDALASADPWHRWLALSAGLFLSEVEESRPKPANLRQQRPTQSQETP